MNDTDKFVEKSGVVKAFKFDGDLMNKDGHYYVPEWAQHKLLEGDLYFDECELYVKTDHLYFDTFQERRNVKVNIGDYVVKDFKGELCVYNPEVFEREFKPF